MPPGVVTVTSTLPLPAGEVAVIELSELTVKLVASLLPNTTAEALPRFVPVIVTEVPPASGPSLGDTPVTVGGGGRTGAVAEEVAGLLEPPALLAVSCTLSVCPTSFFTGA